MTDDLRLELPALRTRYSRETAAAAIDDAHALLPTLTCRGMCHTSCTLVASSQLEQERALAAGGQLLRNGVNSWVENLLAGDAAVPRCPALGPLGTCTVYALRPTVCRLYGVARDLPCQHGCQPRRWLAAQEGLRLIAYVHEVSRRTEGMQDTVSLWGALPNSTSQKRRGR